VAADAIRARQGRQRGRLSSSAAHGSLAKTIHLADAGRAIIAARIIMGHDAGKTQAMSDTIEVPIPVDAAAAEALRDPMKRKQMGRIISQLLKPDDSVARLFNAMDRLAEDARAQGLTDAIVEEELAAYNAERSG
jgi:hypothetical protein